MSVVETDVVSGLYPADVIMFPDETYHVQSRQWQGIPGIERAVNGRLWATWYSGGQGEEPGNHVILATSGDDGGSWTDPVLVVDPGPHRRTFDPCLWQDTIGRLWLFWAQTGENQYYDGRAGVWAIRTDTPDWEHAQWSEPKRLCHGVMMNKPIVLTNGEWLLPAAVWFKYGMVDFEVPAKDEVKPFCGSGVVASNDCGQTWTWRGAVVDAPARTFDEHMLIERRDGSLWLLYRTLYGVGQSTSTDGGRTWKRPKVTEIQCPDSRFFIRRLLSGALLLVTHDEHDEMPSEWKGRSHLTAYVSDDDGYTWQGGLLLDERGRVSYPDGIQTADGLIYLIYDHNRGDRWAYAHDREILMAVFREEDIRAKKNVSTQAKFKQMISKVPVDVPFTMS